MTNFEEEKIAVKRFFKNSGINCDNFILCEGENEPCDVYCKNNDQKFQVTWDDHVFQGEIRRNNFFESTKKVKDRINDIVFDPIKKKLIIYGKSAEGIILLVRSAKNYKFLDNYLKKIKEDISKLENNYFEEIYLVCPKYNRKLY